MSYKFLNICNNANYTNIRANHRLLHMASLIKLQFIPWLTRNINIFGVMAFKL